jgi:hypothetical protein
MSSIAIITDTDSSLPAEAAARYGIRHCCTTVAAQGGRYLSPFTLGRLHWCECGIEKARSFGRDDYSQSHEQDHERRDADDKAHTSQRNP